MYSVCWRIRFSAFAHLQKTLITAISDNVPDPDIPLMVLSNKTFQVLILEKLHITESYMIKFVLNIWNHGKNLQDLSAQNPCKNEGLV